MRRSPFRPFPKLWEFFADEPDTIAMLDSGLPFDAVSGFSKDMATGKAGKDALRSRIKATVDLTEAHWKGMRNRL